MAVVTIAESGSAVGEVYLVNTTSFPIIGSRAFREPTEANAKVQVYEALTWANFYVKVSVNDASSTTSANTRVNGANGNQSVSIGSGTTGDFEDTINTDSLSANDEINYQVVRGAGGTNFRIPIFSTTMENATNGVRYMIGRDVDISNNAGTRFWPIVNESQSETTEANAENVIRFAATMSRLREFYSVNTLNGAVTVVSRINSADGNLTMSITAATTGEFEDTSNSDTLAAGDTIDLSHTEGATTGSATAAIHQVRLIGTSSNAFFIAHSGADAINDGETNFCMLEGVASPSTEPTTQMKFRAVGATVNNLFFRSQANSIDGVTTVRNRINGANGSLSVSVGSLATGNFEDTSNEDEIKIGDTANFQLVAAGTTGTLNFEIMSLQLAEDPTLDPDPPTVTVTTPPISLTLSGTRAAVLNAGVYVVEHQIPGMSGGIIEKTGFPATRIQYRGFFFSGADDEMKKLHDAVGKQVELSIPATNSGRLFFSGIVFISRGPNMTISPGRSYAYYDYNIEFVSQS